MQITGQAALDAPREHIWPLIFDPRALLELLPGCEDVRETAPGEYEARLNLRVPAIAGAYLTRVRVLEAQPPGFCRFEGEANGPAGSLAGQASFTLSEQGEGSRIEYAGDARISGPLAGMNSRFAEGIAKSLIGQGLARLPALANARAAEAEAARATGIPQHAAPRSALARLRAWVLDWWARLFRRPAN